MAKIVLAKGVCRERIYAFNWARMARAKSVRKLELKLQIKRQHNALKTRPTDPIVQQSLKGTVELGMMGDDDAWPAEVDGDIDLDVEVDAEIRLSVCDRFGAVNAEC